MFGSHSDNGFEELIKGIKIKTISHGESTLMAKFLLSKGSSLPEHDHPYEQTGYLVEGSIRLYIEDKSKVLTSGDSWSIPANIKHKSEVINDSIIIEVFSPCRPDYLQYINAIDISE